jgi:glycine cleavage system H protein
MGAPRRSRRHVTVGITDHAQELLGDLVFVELPEVGRKLKAEQEAPSSNRSRPPPTSMHRSPARSSKSTRRRDAPESVNQDAYAAWLFKMKPANAADDALLDADCWRSPPPLTARPTAAEPPEDRHGRHRPHTPLAPDHPCPHCDSNSATSSSAATSALPTPKSPPCWPPSARPASTQLIARRCRPRSACAAPLPLAEPCPSTRRWRR